VDKCKPLAVGLMATGANPHTVFRSRDEAKRVSQTTRRNAVGPTQLHAAHI